MDADMARVLDNVGLTLRDEFVLRLPGHGPCPRFNTLIAGTARMCNYSAFAAYAVEPCVQGKTSLTFALQSYNHPDGSLAEPNATGGAFELLDRFEAPWGPCIRELVRAANGTACRMQIVRQWFSLVPGIEGSRVCLAKLGGKNFGVVSRTLRVMAQTLSVGRGWEWARRFHPAVDAYARARLDSAWCLPNARPGTRGLLVTDANSVMLGGEEGVRQASDMFGFVSVDGAAAYFEAWRVWREIDCSRICFASPSETRACNFWLGHLCTGENPLAMSLCDRFGGNNVSAAGGAAGAVAGGGKAARVDWRRDGFRPPAFIRPYTATHVARRKNGVISIGAIINLLAKRRRLQCPSCTPGCMWGLKRAYTLNSPARFAARAALGPRATLAALTESLCTSEWQNEYCAAAAQLRDMTLPTDPPTVELDGPGDLRRRQPTAARGAGPIA